jgi:GNAT superfamily N-acetyltransferase
MREPTIVLNERPDDADRKAIVEALIAYNDQAGGPSGYRPLAILITDPDSGDTLGGLWGKTFYDWLFVELLVVPERFRGRGLGSTILRQAEQIARQRGCIGAYLDTMGFQAPGFYLKSGYQVFGTIDDHPRGSRRTFFKKVF